jgi:hypothetical protein
VEGTDADSDRWVVVPVVVVGPVGGLVSHRASLRLAGGPLGTLDRTRVAGRMRRAELAGLRWGDIDFPRARLTPRRPGWS